MLTKWVPTLVSVAVGALLAAAFLDLLPEAFRRSADATGLFATVLIGIVAFFLLEKLALWRHHHAHGANAAKPPERAALLILVGDGVHNFVDGVLIAAAFLTDTSLGIVTTLAVIAHEIPQEVGDFMLLLNAGLSRTRALLLNLVASLTAVAGGLAGYLLFDAATAALPYVLALAAASFIYVAVADLIPVIENEFGAAASGRGRTRPRDHRDHRPCRPGARRADFLRRQNGTVRLPARRDHHGRRREAWRPWAAGEARESRMVFIGRKLPHELFSTGMALYVRDEAHHPRTH